MDKYIRLTRRSLGTLAGKVSAKLRVTNNEVSVVTTSELRPKRPAGDMEGLLRDLISMRTVTGDYEEAHEGLAYIDEYLSERAMHVKRFEWNGFESLVATSQRTLAPKVMFVCHLDVVPGADELFTLREKNGKYYGRGTYDMKFAIPPALQLIDDLDRENQLQKYDVGIMITTDEEIGGFECPVRLIEEGYLPGVAVLPDGGTDWKMETFCKGFWLFTMTATGKNAHGSRPWEGDSAIQKILNATQQIQALFTGTKRTDSTLTLSMMSGGTAVNQVPDIASMNLDIRLGSFDDARRLVPQVKKICASNGVKIEGEVFSNPVVNSLKTPLVGSFSQSVQKVTGVAPAESLSFASGDARHFAAKGVPCVVIRPPGGDLHGPDEWVSKKDFFLLKDIFRDYIEREARYKQPKSPKQ